jgi:xanthine/CO dehydrogenase XdhC/CoxF family maturation factor
MGFKSLGKKGCFGYHNLYRGIQPTGSGAKMLVRADGTYIGSMDLGSLEAEVCRKAIKAIEEGRREIFRFELYYEGKEKT